MGLYSIWAAEFASIEQFPEALMISGNLPCTYMVIQGEGQTCPSRVNDNGPRLTEITLVDGVVSKVG